MKPVIICFVLLPFVAWALLLDAVNTNKGGSIDLRNRVTGARIAAAHKDPYIYKWNPSEPTAYLDLYNQPGALLSNTTVSPWVLAIQALFNDLNYRTIQWLWFFIQYGVLILAIYLWTQCHNPSKQTSTPIWGIVCALLFCLTPSWRHHVDHGQIYSVYAGLLLIVYWLSHQARRSIPFSLAEGFGNAFLIGSRPTFLPQLAEPSCRKRWYTLIGTVFGLMIILIVPMAIFGQSIWVQYREAMQTHAENYLHQRPPESIKGKYPATIENIPIDVIKGYSKTIPYTDTSIYKLISFAIPAKAILAFWFISMVACMLFLMIRKAPSQLIWLSATAWIIIGDFLLPAFRHTYNDIFTIPLLLIGLSATQAIKPRYQKYWLIASFSVLGLMIISWKFKTSWLLPLPSIAMLWVAIASITWSIWAVIKKQTVS